jgi:hypothetical protein
MYKSKLTWSILVLSIIFASCRKENDGIEFEFEVTTQDFYASTPIEGVSVKAHTKGVSSGTYTNTFELQASETTSSSGSTNFNVPYGGIEVIRMEFEKDGYFNQIVEYNPDDFSTNEKNAITINLKKEAAVSIRIQNTAPISAFDEIMFNTLNSDCDECVQFSSLVFTGFPMDTTLSGTVVANRYYKYQYIVTKSGVTTNYLDSAYCDNDTTFIEINY